MKVVTLLRVCATSWLTRNSPTLRSVKVARVLDSTSTVSPAAAMLTAKAGVPSSPTLSTTLEVARSGARLAA